MKKHGILLASVFVLFLFGIMIVPGKISARAAETLPFKADLENIWKYNIGAGNVGDIGYVYDENTGGVKLYLDGNLSGFSAIEFAAEVDTTAYPILSFDISDNTVKWAVKLYDGSKVGVDLVMEKSTEVEHAEASGHYSYDLNHDYKPDLAGDKSEDDALRGYSGKKEFTIKFFIVDKSFTGGSLILNNLTVSAPGYEGEYSDGIRHNEKPEIPVDENDADYQRRNENYLVFSPILYPHENGVPFSLYVIVYVALALNVALFIFLFFKLFYRRLRDEHRQRKEERNG